MTGWDYTCRLCKYQWEQKPGEELPINVDPALIHLGKQRLDEEEWRRRQAAAAYRRMNKK